jgi:hypothetical protein
MQNLESSPIVKIQVFSDLLEENGRALNEKSNNRFYSDWSALDVCRSNNGSDTDITKVTHC